MGRPLHVLILEDSEDDTQLLLLELRRIGYEVDFERVDTADAMQAVLTEKPWDVILSDYTMPRFSALHALEVLKASHLDLPFIIISGTIGEETAVAALKAGAHDFLIKGNFARLGSVIERELLEAETRRDLKRAEEALQPSEELFGAAFQHSPVGICITTLDGRFQNVSQSLVDMLGFTSTELEGKRFNDITHPDDLEIGRDAVSRMISGRVPSVSFEKRYLHKTGEPVWALVSSSLLRDSSGQPVHLITYILNMTERKQAEEVLTASEARYRMLFESNPHPMWVYDLETLCFLAINDAAIEHYDYSHDEFLSMTIKDIRPAEDIPALMANLATVQQDFNTPTTWRHQKKDGTVVDVEISSHVIEWNERPARLVLANDITKRKRAERQIQQQLERLTALSKIDQAIISSFDLNLTLDILLSQVISQLKVDAANVLLVIPAGQMLDYAAGRGFRTNAIETASIHLADSEAARERRLIHVEYLEHKPDERLLTQLGASEGFVCYFGLPLIVKVQVKGVLEIFHRAPLQPNPEWLDFLNILAGQAAIAIENATLFENLERSNQELSHAYDATIEGWSRALDLRDKETEGHTQRVTEMTIKLARAFSLPEEELLHIRWGALLHDIGKMGVPDNILLKPGALTPEEWEIMSRHPEFAYSMLAPITYLRRALDIPYYHHEKWDGTGYPHGLKGEAIPLAARLFAVVDVWDALRSDRPYRPAWTKEKTLEHIQSLSGTHFDPKVVEYFLEVIK